MQAELPTVQCCNTAYSVQNNTLCTATVLFSGVSQNLAELHLPHKAMHALTSA